jgi:hypothetical protein
VIELHGVSGWPHQGFRGLDCRRHAWF